MKINLLHTFAFAAAMLTAATTVQAVELNYNFTAQLTNNSGGFFFVDGSFNADPTVATTMNGTDPVGETYSVAPNGIATSLTDVAGTVLPALDTIVYTNTDVQNPGLVFFSSYNPGDNSADPIWTLSQSIGTNEYLTLLLNGSSAELFESATIGDTSGTPIADGPGVTAYASNVPSVPEPATFGLIAIAGMGAFAFRRFAANRR